MRELYCKKCGKKINTKLWMVPNSCVCGVNLDEWQKDSGRTTFRYLLCIFLLMLPLLFAYLFTTNPIKEFDYIICSYSFDFDDMASAS